MRHQMRHATTARVITSHMAAMVGISMVLVQKEEGMMFRRLLLVAMLCLPGSAATAAGLKVLGIPYTWDMEDARFSLDYREIPDKQGIDAEALTARLDLMLKGLVVLMELEALGELSASDIPPLQCLFPENAPERRDDLLMVAICFAQDRLVMIVPFFHGTTGDDLRPVLDAEYGAEIGRDTWQHLPWHHLGRGPQRLILLLDADDHRNGEDLAEEFPVFDSALVYVNLWNLVKLQEDLQDEKEKGL